MSLRIQWSVWMEGLNQERYGTVHEIQNWDIGDPLQTWKLKLLPLHSSKRQHDLLLPLEWLAREGADGIAVPLVGHPVPLVGRVCWWTEGAASVCHAIAVSGWEAAVKEEEEEKGGENGNQTTMILYNDLAKQVYQTMCLLTNNLVLLFMFYWVVWT